MKRYLLFAGDTHYAQGGMHDFISDHDTAEAAVREGHEFLGDDQEDCWFHVWDREAKAYVGASEFQAHGAPVVSG